MAIVFTSERVSDEYLSLNNCGTENFFHKKIVIKREGGRADYLILYIAKGVCRAVIDDEQQLLKEGSLILFRPYEKQSYSFGPEYCSSMFVHFTGRGCEALLKKIHMDKGNIFYIGKDPLYEKTFADLEHNFFYQQSNSAMFCSAYLYLLLSIIGRNLKGDTGKALLHDNRIERACTNIYIRYNYPLDIQKLADECYLSISRFSHLFRQMTGYSPLAFQRHIRVEKSKLLLENQNYSIGEIAQSVGYDDQNYFSRVFTKETGLSPTKYRKQREDFN